MHYLPLLLALGLLVALHELGHLVVARLLGIRVERYTFGFGPAVFTWRWRETDYVMGAVPLGGSVRIQGMNPHAPGHGPVEATSFPAQRPWKRMVVLLGGPLANALFSLGVLFALYTTGTHVVVPLTVGTITPGSEAARAQLLPGDRLVSVDGELMESWSGFVELIARRPGREVHLGVERQGEERDVVVRPRVDERGFGRIGVSQQYVYRAHDPGQALLQALAHTGNLVIEAGRWVDRLRLGTQGIALSNPLGVVKQSSGAAGSGLGAFLRVMVSLSMALALFHLLPLPSLDGGRIVFLLIESVSGRKVPPRVETLVHAVGFITLLGMVLTVSLADLRQRVGQARQGADTSEPGDSPLFLWEKAGDRPTAEPPETKSPPTTSEGAPPPRQGVVVPDISER
ncbi:MAG: M50 family metallopeptidase [Cystobacter sp.]